MKPKRFSSYAIVLHRTNYSEADRIITLLTRDYGKISVMAKGVQRPTSRKRGALEVFSLIKFSANSGKNLDLLLETELINNYSNIRSSLTKTSLAYYLVEITNKLLGSDEDQPEVFDLLNKYLVYLTKSVKHKTLRKKYIEELLVILGFWSSEKKLTQHDIVLENILEKQVNSQRVGKKLQK